MLPVHRMRQKCQSLPLLSLLRGFYTHRTHLWSRQSWPRWHSSMSLRFKRQLAANCKWGNDNPIKLNWARSERIECVAIIKTIWKRASNPVASLLRSKEWEYPCHPTAYQWLISPDPLKAKKETKWTRTARKSSRVCFSISKFVVSRVEIRSGGMTMCKFLQPNLPKIAGDRYRPGAWIPYQRYDDEVSSATTTTINYRKQFRFLIAKDSVEIAADDHTSPKSSKGLNHSDYSSGTSSR